MTKKLIFIVLFFTGCTNRNPPRFELRPLSPVVHEFKSGKNKSRIDYFFLNGNFSYEKSHYTLLKNKVSRKVEMALGKNYYLYSIYIYRGSELLDDHNNHSGTNGFDGQNKNLIAYIRYRQNQLDIFYIIKNGNVVFDQLNGKDVDFEFDQ